MLSSSRSPYYYRTRANPQGSPLVQTSTAYLTFITLGGSPLVFMIHRSSLATVVSLHYYRIMGLTVLFNPLTPNGAMMYQEIGSVVTPHPA